MTAHHLLYTAGIFALMVCACAAVSVRSQDTAKHFLMDITELGTEFVEKIDVDPENGLEIFTVPAHNDMDAATYIMHFPSKLQMEVLEAPRECYLQDMSQGSRLGKQPEPEDLLEAIESDEMPTDKAEAMNVETFMDRWTIEGEVGDDQRLELPPIMQQRCEGFKMYYTRRLRDVVKVEETDGDDGEDMTVQHSLHEQLRMLEDHHRVTRGAGVPGPRCVARNIGSRCHVRRSTCSYCQQFRTVFLNCRLGKKPRSCSGIIHNKDQICCCVPCCKNAKQADSKFFLYCNQLNNVTC